MSMDEQFTKEKSLKFIVYTIDIVYTIEYNVRKLIHYKDDMGVSRTHYKR